MKYRIHSFLMFLVATMVIASCAKDPDIVESYAESDATRNDAFKQVIVNTPVVSFVAGEDGYSIEFLVITPDNDDTKNVNVHATFQEAVTGATSNEILLGTFPVTQGANTTTIGATFTYEDLVNGMMLNGAAMPADPVNIPVGSVWNLRLEPVDSGGNEDFSSSGILIGVLSPFAGLYRVLESDYYRIGAQSGAADWSGTEIFIGSVDATTFSHVDWWGPFASPGQFIFTLNDDNTITVPDTPEQLFFSGNDMLTCQEDGGSFANVPCDGSNVLEPSPDGKHIIKLTYGYFTASGDENEGAREFYEVLEKIVVD